MKKLGYIFIIAMLPTGAFAWAGYDYAPVTIEAPRGNEQEVASYDPAMQPLDMNEVVDSDSITTNDSTMMPLDAD